MVDHRCPKCGGGMSTQERRGIAAAICDECAGLWIDTAMLDMLASRGDSKAAMSELATWVESDPVSIREHDCPVCAGTLRPIGAILRPEAADWIRRGRILPLGSPGPPSGQLALAL